MGKLFREQRRRYYIRKEYQRNFIFTFCLLVVSGSALSSLLIYVMSASTVTTTFENARLTIKSTADYILPAVLLSSAIVAVLTGIAAFVVTLLTSHKVAGALYAIEKNVERVASGDLQAKFHLRAHDEIRPLAVSLDVMVSNLKENIREIKKAVTALEESMAGPHGGDIPPDIRRALEKLKSNIETFNT